MIYQRQNTSMMQQTFRHWATSGKPYNKRLFRHLLQDIFLKTGTLKLTSHRIIHFTVYQRLLQERPRYELTSVRRAVAPTLPNKVFKVTTSLDSWASMRRTSLSSSINSTLNRGTVQAPNTGPRRPVRCPNSKAEFLFLCSKRHVRR